MTPTTILASLLGIALYLLVGMVLTHHTKLGHKYYHHAPIRLTFFYIIPIMGIVIYLVGLIIIQMVDELLFGCILEKEGISSIVK